MAMHGMDLKVKRIMQTLAEKNNCPLGLDIAKLLVALTFWIWHAHWHHWHAFHQWAGDLVHAVVAHLDHVSVIWIHANIHLAFHGGSGVS